MDQSLSAQVANLKGPGGVVNAHLQGPPSRSTISVQSSGEIWTPPDTLQFTITVKNSKESMEEAQSSVKRRTDYIAQVIRKNGVSSGSMVLSTDVTRAGSGGGGGLSPGPCSSGMPQPRLATVCTEVVVKCDSVGKCEIIRNMLIEKLDTSVEISPVSFWHSAEAKEKAR